MEACEMSQMSNTNAQKGCEAKMSGNVESMRCVLREIAEGQQAPTTQRAIEMVARLIGFTYRRTYGLYYGTARSVSAEEWIAAQNARMKQRRARRDRLRAELAALEMSLGDQDATHLEMGRGAFWVDRRSSP
jgi:hypothetical protein